MSESGAPGTVYLVGAGPGPAGLITVRGRDLIASADAVLYDRRSQRRLLPPRGSGPARLYVGARGAAAPSAAEVQQILVGLARQGKRVVYLTEGDPLAFGRGTEVAQALHDADVSFEIVPGVTLGSAASTYAGVPLLSRTLSGSVVFVNALGQAGGIGGAHHDWSAIARVGGTVVVHNAQRDLSATVAGFAEAGVPGEIPVAAITGMGRPTQRVVVANLDSITGVMERELVRAAVTLVIGWTVLLRDELAWFDTRPLFGRRVLVARARHGSDVVARALRELGAGVLELPWGDIARLDLSALRGAVENIAGFEWLVFASPDAVATFWDVLLSSGRDTRALAGARIAAVGAATAAALLDHGVTVDVVQDRFERVSLVNVLLERSDVPGAELLYVAGDSDAESFGRELEGAGAVVTALPIYRETPPGTRAKPLLRAIDAGRVDLAVVLSPDAAVAYMNVVGTELAARVPAAAQDAATAAVLSEGGVEVVVQSEAAGVEQMTEAVRGYLSGAG